MLPLSLRPAARVPPSAIVSLCGWIAMLPLLGCGDSEADAKNKSFEKVTTVETLVIQPRLLRDTVQFGGQLASEKSVVLKSEVDGILASIEFEEGQYVEKDDVLFRLRSDEQVALLKVAEANLALAISEAKRAQRLLSLDAAAQALRDRTAAEKDVAQARVELARIALSRTRIRAPFDGLVGMRLVSPGAFLNEKIPLVQIDAVDRLQATFAMGEIALPFARVGIPVEVLVAPYPGERFPGEVFFVSPTLDTKARRLLVKAWIPNPERRLAAGLYANIEVEIRLEEDALVIPESAVVADRLGSFVWRVDEENIATRVSIELGLRKGGQVEVTGGLVGGERIVTAGTHKVNDGKKVAHSNLSASGQASVPSEEPAGEGT
ncbi:MAG: efflux RND transporter periplasmic adaptor subunit [Myxococcota bacterium]